MRRRPIVSPYSMMYLVTPAIYEKLLLCIDEGDKKLLDNLNKPQGEIQDRRPAQLKLDVLSSDEIKPIVPIHTSQPEPQPIDPIPISQPPPMIYDQPGPVSVVPQQENIEMLNIDPNVNVPIISQQPQQQQQQPIGVPIIPQQPQQQQQPIGIPALPQADPIAPIIPSQDVIMGAPKYQANVKPITFLPSNVTQPASFSQPVVQPLPAVINIPLPQEQMVVDKPSLKRQLKDTDFHQSIQGRKKPVDKNIVQWQPLQCVTNTTGGQICNPDPVNQPAIVQSDQIGLIRQPTNNPGNVVPISQGPRGTIRVRDDLLEKNFVCKICGVHMGDQEYLILHYRWKHKMKNIPPDENIMAPSSSNIQPSVQPIIPPDITLQQQPQQFKYEPKSETKVESKDFDKPYVKFEPQSNIKTEPKVGKIRKKRKRFNTPGSQRPATPFVYSSKADVSFRQFQKKKPKRKRFNTPGNEPKAEPLQYDPAKDVSFRKQKAKKVLRQPIPKSTKFRCPICNVSFNSLAVLKTHISNVHNEDPNDVIRDMASNVLSNPQPGGSRDFTDWTSLRLQPPRAVQRRREFGTIKKTTTNFEKWA